MFGEVNVWRIAKSKDIGEIKFGELIDFSHKDAIYKLWLVKVWRTTDDSPNSPNFPAAKHPRYTVYINVMNVLLRYLTIRKTSV